jgi:hypothetical protein
MREDFPNFLKKARKLRGKSVQKFTQKDWIELICKDCQFYHEEEEEKLECAAFKILRELILRKVISLEEASEEFGR